MPINPRAPRRPRPITTALWVVIAAATGPGCGTVQTSGTSRTGTEQLLLTNAWDTALMKVDFRPLAGVPVYFDTGNVTAIDQGYVVSSLNQAMLTQGVLLRQKPEQAQWVVEARVGVYGTDSKSWLIGVQQTTVPQTVTGVPSGTIPEIPLIKKQDQSGMAKLAMFAYDRNSRSSSSGTPARCSAGRHGQGRSVPGCGTAPVGIDPSPDRDHGHRRATSQRRLQPRPLRHQEPHASPLLHPPTWKAAPSTSPTSTASAPEAMLEPRSAGFPASSPPAPMESLARWLEV